MGLSYAEVVQELHHLGTEVSDTIRQAPFPPNIEGNSAEMAREGRDLLEPGPSPEA